MTTIITKHGSGAPTAGQLSQGELAVDLTNKELYTKDSGGNVIKVGSQGGSSGTFTDLVATDSFTSPGIDDNATSTAITIDANENVGIGTTSPSSYHPGARNLVIAESGDSGLTVASGASSLGRILFADGTSGTDKFKGYLVYEHTDNSMQFGTDSLEAMRITSDGNVCIGTDSPSGRLHISGIRPVSTLTDTASTASYGWQPTEGDLRLYDQYANQERMRIDASGNVGIGTNAPNIMGWGNALTVDSSTQPAVELAQAGVVTGYFASQSDGRVRLGNQVSGQPIQFLTADAGIAAVIDGAGNLLVGTTSSINSHTIRSTSKVPLSVYRDNGASSNSLALFYSDIGGTQTTHCSIRGNGDLENTNNSYGGLSDERLKSNIVTASSQLDDIMSVQVRSYTLKTTGDTHIGVVAQELEASGMSGLVSENDDGMKSVKYSILYLKAIKALQEAVTRIETLEAEVAAIKGA